MIINFLAILIENRDWQSGNWVYEVGEAKKRTNIIQLKKAFHVQKPGIGSNFQLNS